MLSKQDSRLNVHDNEGLFSRTDALLDKFVVFLSLALIYQR